MDVQMIITLVGSLGFPIFACCFLGWFIYKVVLDLQKTIEKNTKILEKILTKLDIHEGGEDDGR